MTSKCKIFILAASIALPKGLNGKEGVIYFSEMGNEEAFWSGTYAKK